jgi:succinylarginine dihydrolase
MKSVELNLDGLVGPTHNYAGLSHGNLASEQHAAAVSHPRQAALQGLAKMALLHDLGVPQAVLPPQSRPRMDVLRSFGFRGTDCEILDRLWQEDRRLLAAVYSSSAMWAANAATVSPAADCADGRVHFTPANLITQFHRSIETQETSVILKAIFPGDAFTHHDPLPAADAFADEGAANHLRLCGEYGLPGLEIFVYGRDVRSAPARYPARQTKQACEAIARCHQLDPDRTMILQQSTEAIDAGAFHNDVVAASNQNVLLVHGNAFADPNAIDAIRARFIRVVGTEPWIFIADPAELSLADAVSTYLFNSQIVTVPDGTMAVIAPLECRDHSGVQRYLDRVVGSGCPVKTVHYVDLRQSMHNGGGPACLRLRVVLTTKQMELTNPDVIFSNPLHDRLVACVQEQYRETLYDLDLRNQSFAAESTMALHHIQNVLGRALINPSEPTSGFLHGSSAG